VLLPELPPALPELPPELPDEPPLVLPDPLDPPDPPLLEVPLSPVCPLLPQAMAIANKRQNDAETRHAFMITSLRPEWTPLERHGGPLRSRKRGRVDWGSLFFLPRSLFGKATW
jgi:hypothetical protein